MKAMADFIQFSLKNKMVLEYGKKSCIHLQDGKREGKVAVRIRGKRELFGADVFDGRGRI
jgi:hypothetical protein